jgi:hypothetical protein
MSQQASHLPRSVQIIGRYKTLIGFTAVLGLLGGIILAALNPPGSTSRALVMFAAPSCPQGAICGGPMFSPGYAQARVIKLFPGEIQISPVSGNVLSVTAVGGSAAQAQATARAAVRSFIAYVGSLTYLGEQASAQILPPTTQATGTTTPKQLFGYGLLGAVFGALAGVIAALAAGQAIIDPVTLSVALPQAFGVDGAAREAGGETGYGSPGVSLKQLAVDYVKKFDDASGDG